MRVAALYDVHGNLPALNAVLADVERERVDLVVVGGDVALGPMPGETLERLLALGERARFLRGNADRDLVEWFDGRSAGGEDVWERRGAWAAQALTRAQRDVLARLPPTICLEVDGLGRTLFCHGSPRSDDEIVTRLTGKVRLRELLAGVAEPVVVCGHTHVQFDRTLADIRIVNAGSVGMPYEGKPGAYWALLGPDVELRRTSYDLEHAAARVRTGAFPDADAFVESLLHPTGPDEASRFFERLAADRVGRDRAVGAGVLAVFGPTASGKSAVAAELTGRLPAEAISADAFQVYRGLPILTAQPAEPTQLVAIRDLDEDFSVGEYERLAHAAIDAAIAAGRLPVVVGGTGLYLRAALAEIDLPPPPPPGLRERVDRLYERLGPERSHALLAERDPAAAAAVHANDRRRVVRALELVELGRSLAPAGGRLWTDEARYPTLIVGLDVPRDALADRIVERTEAMFAAGVEAEVEAALARPLSATAQKVLGLREVAELPRAPAIEQIALRTRQLAAYQRKWMRRIPGIVMIDARRPVPELADEILDLGRARKLLSRLRG